MDLDDHPGDAFFKAHLPRYVPMQCLFAKREHITFWCKAHSTAKFAEAIASLWAYNFIQLRGLEKHFVPDFAGTATHMSICLFNKSIHSSGLGVVLTEENAHVSPSGVCVHIHICSYRTWRASKSPPNNNENIFPLIPNIAAITWNYYNWNTLKLTLHF